MEKSPHLKMIHVIEFFQDVTLQTISSLQQAEEELMFTVEELCKSNWELIQLIFRGQWLVCAFSFAFWLPKQPFLNQDQNEEEHLFHSCIVWFISHFDIKQLHHFCPWKQFMTAVWRTKSYSELTIIMLKDFGSSPNAVILLGSLRLEPGSQGKTSRCRKVWCNAQGDWQ